VKHDTNKSDFKLKLILFNLHQSASHARKGHAFICLYIIFSINCEIMNLIIIAKFIEFIETRER